MGSASAPSLVTRLAKRSSVKKIPGFLSESRLAETLSQVYRRNQSLLEGELPRKETAMALTDAWHDIVHDMQDEMHDLATITRQDAARQAYLALWATMIAFPLVFGL